MSVLRMTIHRFRVWRGTGHVQDWGKVESKIQRVHSNHDQRLATSVRDPCVERAFTG